MNTETHDHFVVYELSPTTYQFSLLPELKPVAWTELGTTFIGENVMDHLTDDEILELLKLASKFEKLTKGMSDNE